MRLTNVAIHTDSLAGIAPKITPANICSEQANAQGGSAPERRAGDLESHFGRGCRGTPEAESKEAEFTGDG
jgi:hypothetical protein